MSASVSSLCARTSHSNPLLSAHLCFGRPRLRGRSQIFFPDLTSILYGTLVAVLRAVQPSSGHLSLLIFLYIFWCKRDFCSGSRKHVCNRQCILSWIELQKWERFVLILWLATIYGFDKTDGHDVSHSLRVDVGCFGHVYQSSTPLLRILQLDTRWQYSWRAKRLQDAAWELRYNTLSSAGGTKCNTRPFRGFRMSLTLSSALSQKLMGPSKLASFLSDELVHVIPLRFRTAVSGGLPIIVASGLRLHEQPDSQFIRKGRLNRIDF